MSGAGGARILAPVPRREMPRRRALPTFSFVIPAFQAAATIGAALESALTQTSPAHEVIVVDDGSTDEIDAALAPFAGRITLIRKPNGGVASARNAGAAAASGEFIVVLDADDRCDPRRLEALGELAMARPDLDLLATDVVLTTAGKPDGLFRDRTPFEIDDQRTAILRSCFPGGWLAARRSRLLEVGGFDEGLRTGEDWDCWLRMIFAGSLVGLVELPYYEYTADSNGLTASRVASLWDRVTLLEKAGEHERLSSAERRTLARSLRHCRSRAATTEVRAGTGRLRAARLAVLRGVGLRTRLRCCLAVVR
jgi:glycosyltransferase involved in cell wall biosynthesis